MPSRTTRSLSRVDLGDPPALAVVDVGAAVVDAGDDLIAGGEGPHHRPRSRRLRACPPGLRTSPRHLVQPLDLGVPLGDHHRVLAALIGLMPVADHRLAPLPRRSGATVTRSSDSVEAQSLTPLSLADPLRRLAVELVLVADHLVKVDRLAAIRDRAEQAACLDLAIAARGRRPGRAWPAPRSAW